MYHRDDPSSGHLKGTGRLPQTLSIRKQPVTVPGERKCYICDSGTHLMKDCKVHKSKSSATSRNTSKVPPFMASAQTKIPNKPAGVTVICSDSIVPLDYLLSSSNSQGDINIVRITDKGSMPQCVQVEI